MAGQLSDFFARAGVPEADGFVVPGRGQLFAVWREGNGTSASAGVGRDGFHGAPGGHPEQRENTPAGGIVAGIGNELGVGREGDTPDPAIECGRTERLGTGRGIPKAEVLAAGGDVLAVW